MKYKRVRISGVFLTNLSVEGQESHAKCIKGLPEGTKFVYAIPEPANGIWMVVEHESFPELKDGDIIPEFESPIMFIKVESDRRILHWTGNQFEEIKFEDIPLNKNFTIRIAEK